MAKITANTLKTMIVVVIMATLFFSMIPSLLYTLSSDIDDSLQMVEGNSTLYGTGPSTIAGTVQANWGYFIVVGLLLLIISVVGGVFKSKR